MTAEELDRIFTKKPFQPFRLRLLDGEEITVSKPRKSLVSGDDVAVVGVCRRDNGESLERFRMFSVDRVISAEFIPNGPSVPDGGSPKEKQTSVHSIPV